MRVQTVRIVWDQLPPPPELDPTSLYRAPLAMLPRELTGQVETPIRPFAFYVTRGGAAVHIDRLMFGSDLILSGVPGSLLAPRPDDFIDGAPTGEASNIGDQPPVLPGQSVRIEVRNVSSAPVDFEALVLGTAWTPDDDDDDDRRYEARRQLHRKSKRAEKFFLALVGPADNRRGGIGYEELRALARKFAAEWSAEDIAIETAAGFPPPERAPARPRYRMAR